MSNSPKDESGPDQHLWPPEAAWEWYRSRPWLCGVNFVPSTAVNTTEMWQSETFDAPTIDRELGWAAGLGMNCARVFVQYLVWAHDPAGLLERMDRFLGIADSHGIATMFVLLDDCSFAGKDPFLGPQEEPVPGVFAGAWTPSPGPTVTRDEAAWPQVKAYILDVVARFATDERVLAWDLYNEPGQGEEQGNVALLNQAMNWIRECDHTQPVTSGTWSRGTAVEEAVLAGSDIVSLHHYGRLPDLEDWIAELNQHGRPVIVTEWLARPEPYASRIPTHLPALKAAHVGCFCWGLVDGRMQVRFGWNSPPGAPEPEIWHHDLLHTDGTPHDAEEIALLKRLTGAS